MHQKKKNNSKPTGLSFLNKGIEIFLLPQATSKFQVFCKQTQQYTKQS